MVFKYEHPEWKNEETLYNEQLIKWLILRGYISKDNSLKILDVGAGRGHFFFALKKLGYNNAVATDLCPEFKECVKGDITKKLPFKNETFDLVISRDIAEHIRDSEKFFTEQRRILKKNGVLIVMTPNTKHMKFSQFYDDYTHVMPYTPKSLSEAFQMHGFTQVKVMPLRAIPKLWKYTPRAFDYLFSTKKNNLFGIARKK